MDDFQDIFLGALIAIGIMAAVYLAFGGLQ